jgi:hypothetical protein
MKLLTEQIKKMKSLKYKTYLSLYNDDAPLTEASLNYPCYEYHFSSIFIVSLLISETIIKDGLSYDEIINRTN